MLPIEIQMQIDLSAQHHSREVADGFAKARERLTPEPAKAIRLQDLCLNTAWLTLTAQQILDMRPGGIVQAQPWQYQNNAWNSVGGLSHSLFGCVS